MLSMLGKNFSRQRFEIFFFFFFSEDSKETVCMKCQILFSGKKKNIIILSSVELAQRVVKMKLNGYSFQRQNNPPPPYTHTPTGWEAYWF